MGDNHKISISFQGGLGSYHHQAASSLVKHLSLNGSDVEFSPRRDFAATLDALNQGCKYAVLAVENSLYGSINPSYQLIEERPELEIVAEVYIAISHQLISSKPGLKKSDITKIYSQREALAQCRGLLGDLPGVEAVEYHDTALAIKYIIDEGMDSSAAIASKAAAEIYGGHIIEFDVQDNKSNYTRFFMLKSGIDPAVGTSMVASADHKASMRITLRSVRGALADLLRTFADSGINLSRIESRPIPGSQYDYSFHIDTDWDNSLLDPGDLEKRVKDLCQDYRLLGVYPTFKDY